jgi:hypothetical protein
MLKFILQLTDIGRDLLGSCAPDSIQIIRLLLLLQSIFLNASNPLSSATLNGLIHRVAIIAQLAIPIFAIDDPPLF